MLYEKNTINYACVYFDCFYQRICNRREYASGNCTQRLESVFCWGYNVQTPVNQVSLSSTRYLKRKSAYIVVTLKSAVKSSRQTRRIFSTITNSLVSTFPTRLLLAVLMKIHAAIVVDKKVSCEYNKSKCISLSTSLHKKLRKIFWSIEVRQKRYF